MTDIQVTFTAQLADNPTARDLAGQLSLTLWIRDFNLLEKIARPGLTHCLVIAMSHR